MRLPAVWSSRQAPCLSPGSLSGHWSCKRSQPLEHPIRCRQEAEDSSASDIQRRDTPAKTAKAAAAKTADTEVAKATEIAAAKPADFAAAEPAVEPAAKSAAKPAAKSAESIAIDHGVPETTAKPQVTFSVCFVTSEVAPWSKTGGLGDVCGSLPPALAKRGHRVMVVAPYYQEYPDSEDAEVELEVFGTSVRYQVCKKHGVDFVFVNHPSYQRLGLYGDAFGPFQDNQWRFALLCLAALEAPLNVKIGGSVYGQEVVFVANDWQGALVSVYLAGKYRPYNVYRQARTIMAIHNLRHQGVYSPGTFGLLGLPGNWYGALEWQYPPHQRQGSYEEEGRAINTLKGGLSTADRIVAVSPGYAYEITTPEGGWGLEGMISTRGYVLSGVLNGIDEEEWSPETDSHIASKFSVENFKTGKAKNKEALQKELGLPLRPDTPLIGFIGRLDYQKGADLVLAAAPWLVKQDCQVVCLGTGDSGLEAGMRWLESTYPDHARGWVGFNVPMSHKITAGADMLLMPSRFEPCGLNQLYAMRYGTAPVAHATGGLRDTVIPYNPWEGSGTGWTFSPCTTESFISALAYGLETYREHKDSFQALQERGMRRDSSWNKAAAEYEQIFNWAKDDAPYTGYGD